MCALAVVAVGVVMVAIGSGNDAAVELLSSHHGTQIRTALEAAKGMETKTARQDSERLSELNKLAAAADAQAKNAMELRSTEKKKLEVRDQRHKPFKPLKEGAPPSMQHLLRQHVTSLTLVTRPPAAAPPAAAPPAAAPPAETRPVSPHS